MYEYIEGMRAKYTATVDGLEILSIYNFDNRLLFQGSRPECRRYARLYKAKVLEHEQRVRSSRREVV